ncbi:hypothetical protein ACFS07_19285 [Undibacterium arcticum]
MIPTLAERQQLAKDFTPDVERMRCCLEAAGHKVKTDRIVRAWADYSESICASWLGLPDEGNDAMLLAILLRYLPPVPIKDAESGLFVTRIMDAGDESGDGILELPDELLGGAGLERRRCTDVVNLRRRRAGGKARG